MVLDNTLTTLLSELYIKSTFLLLADQVMKLIFSEPPLMESKLVTTSLLVMKDLSSGTIKMVNISSLLPKLMEMNSLLKIHPHLVTPSVLF